MKETPEERVERKRRIVAWLRHCADRAERTAAEMRQEADKLDPDREPGIVRDP